MTPTRPVARLAAAAATAVLAAGALLTGAGLIGPAAQADPAAAARGVADPVAGQCHQLTYAQLGAQADPRRPVPCTGKHTTRTIRVAQLPKGLAYSKAQAFSYRTCQTALRQKAGGSALTLAKSTVSYGYFYPTKAEQQAGSRYVRCDILVFNGRSLAQLSNAKAPSLAGGLPDRYRRCNNGSSLFFTCTRPHTNRAVASFTVAGTRYPGDKQIEQIAERRCRQLTTNLGYYYFPLADTWASGKHEVACLKRTRS